MVNWVCALGLLMGAVFPSRDMVASMALSSATSGSMLVGVGVGVAVRRFGVDGEGAARLRSAFAFAARRISSVEFDAFGFVFAGTAAATRVPPAASAGSDAAAGSVLTAAEPTDDGIAADAAA